MSKEGGLAAPVRHSIQWKNDDFYNEDLLNKELGRVFDICHGCRRCVNLCNAFPTLFDLIDESSTMEVDGVAITDYSKVSEHCYLCDLCFMTKCPYVPPHEWAVDFPHLMLRAKAVAFKKHGASTIDKLLTATEFAGNLAGIPVVRQVMNAALQHRGLRNLVGIHPNASIAKYQAQSGRKYLQRQASAENNSQNSPKVAIFTTCYSDRAAPEHIEDLVKVLRHNQIYSIPVINEKCCGIPKLELGDLKQVEKLKENNVPILKKLVIEGFDIIALIPSCVLMFRQILPLMFPEDKDVKTVSQHIFDPCEYLMQQHKIGKLKTDFKQSLGKVVYHAACHTRVQNFGLKTRDLLYLVPNTEVSVIERCSGHNGIYGVKKKTYDLAVKIGSPVASKLKQENPDYFVGDCVLAGEHIASLVEQGKRYKYPISLFRIAYGI